MAFYVLILFGCNIQTEAEAFTVRCSYKNGVKIQRGISDVDESFCKLVYVFICYST